jgi:hypothetical protein
MSDSDKVLVAANRVLQRKKSSAGVSTGNKRKTNPNCKESVSNPLNQRKK